MDATSYLRKNDQQRRPPSSETQPESGPVALPPAGPENILGFQQAMQSLFALAGMMRTMAPEGAPPKLVLSANGMEIRFAGSEAATEASDTALPGDRLAAVEHTLKQLSNRIGKLEKAPGGSPEWVAKVDRTLLELKDSIADLEAQVAAQANAIESLRSAVHQNEEMMETLVDSMNVEADLAHSGLGPSLVLGSESIAS
jgi:hypothetical protein